MLLCRPAFVLAQSTASEIFANGEQAFAANDVESALAYFHSARDAGSQGPAVHYNIGVCYYRLGDYEVAATEFLALAESFPAMQELAEYNVGLVRFAQGRQREARELFERTVTSSDESLAGLSAAMLQRIAPEQQPVESGSLWTRFADFGAGYDSNVALIEESSLPAGQTNESPFVEFFGYASRPLSANSRWRVDLTGYLVDYSDAPNFDQTVVSAAFLHRSRHGDWTLDAGPHYVRSLLDGDGFEHRTGVSLSMQRRLASETVFRMRFSHDEVSELEPKFDFVDGSRDQMRLGIQRNLSLGDIRADIDYEKNDRLGGGVSPVRLRATLRYQRPLQGRWTLDISSMLRDSDFDDSVIPRRETQYEFGLGARRDLSSLWQLKVQLRYIDNDSNDAAFSYSRTRASINLSKVF